MLLFTCFLFGLIAGCTEDPAEDRGEKLYAGYCAGCHGLEGEGFLQLYPPIKNTRFLDSNLNRLPCIIRYGLKGEIRIENRIFNQVMPANQQLSSEDMGDLINYMLEAWQHRKTELMVSDWLSGCSNY